MMGNGPYQIWIEDESFQEGKVAHCILHQYDKVAVSRGLFLQLFFSWSEHT